MSNILPLLCWNSKRVLYRAWWKRPGVSPDLLKTKIQEGLDRIPRVSGDTTTGQGIYVTQRLNKLLVTALDEAKKLKDEYVSVEHLVLAMFSEPPTTDIGKIFKTVDFRRENFLKALTEVRGKATETRSKRSGKAKSTPSTTSRNSVPPLNWPGLKWNRPNAKVT